MSVAYRYRAATAEGRLVEGRLEAATPSEAQDQLRRQSLVPVSVEPDAGRPPGARGRRDDSLAASLRAIATLVAAGQPLERALDFAATHAAREGERHAWRAVLARLRGGDPLSEAMAGEATFPPLAIALVRAGEESGTLDAALAGLAGHLERGSALAAEVRSALLYPMLMGVATGLGVLAVLVVAVPRFVAILGITGGALPWSTRALVAASSLLADGWWAWLPLAGAAALGARAWLRRPANRLRWHAARLGLPLAGALERELDAGRFCRALGVSLGAGVPVLGALRLARGVVGNAATGAALDRATEAVARGEGVANALAGVLPPLAGQLLRAGEEGGQLDAMCLRVAAALEEGAQRRLRDLVRLLEPSLIVLFGVIVGFVALAMLQAMYGVNIS